MGKKKKASKKKHNRNNKSDNKVKRRNIQSQNSNNNLAPTLLTSNFTKEELVEIQSEAYYRALKRIEGEKVSGNNDATNTINTESRQNHQFRKGIAVLIACIFLPIVDLLIYGLKKIGLLKSEKGKEILRIFDIPSSLEEYAIRGITFMIPYLLSVGMYVLFGFYCYVFANKVISTIQNVGLYSVINFSNLYKGALLLGNIIAFFGSGLLFNLIGKSILKQQDIDKVYTFLGIILAIVALKP